MYNVSSLKQLVFGDSAINPDIYKALIKYFKNASIVKVYSMYYFNQLSMIGMYYLKLIIGFFSPIRRMRNCYLPTEQ